jgi:hypothetical protein
VRLDVFEDHPDRPVLAFVRRRARACNGTIHRGGEPPENPAPFTHPHLAKLRRTHIPMEAPDPVAAIRLAMERSGLTPRNLVPMIGRLNRVHGISTGRRGLALAMIRRLHDGLGISAESLIRPSRRRTAA